MDYVRLGRTGLQVSRICLGCMSFGDKSRRDWVLDEKDSMPFFERAIALGINFFDSADIYSNGVSEEILGRALKALRVDREDVVVATKCYFGPELPNRQGLSRKHVLAACDASLKRLGLDYIDLYQIHRFDPQTPYEETAEALNDLVRAGKVRYLGASSMWAWQFANYLRLAEARGWAKFVSMQNHYNLVYREEEREMLPLCREDGIGVIPWSPLARGFLARGEIGDTARAKSDTYSKELYGEGDFEIAKRNGQIAKRLGVKPAQTALAWMLANPAVTAPIVGATKLGHLEDAVDSLKVTLSPEDIKSLEEPYTPRAVHGHS